MSVQGLTVSNSYSLREEVKSKTIRLSTVVLRMLPGNDVIFGMGHEAKHETCFVADAGDVVSASIRIASCIGQCNLIVIT
jgi:hypothetical protein